MYTKLFLRSFNCDPFSCITSQTFHQKRFLIAIQITDSIIYNSNFQYTQDKLSVLDICV